MLRFCDGGVRVVEVCSALDVRHDRGGRRGILADVAHAVDQVARHAVSVAEEALEHECDGGDDHGDDEVLCAFGDCVGSRALEDVG